MPGRRAVAAASYLAVAGIAIGARLGTEAYRSANIRPAATSASSALPYSTAVHEPEVSKINAATHPPRMDATPFAEYSRP